MPLDIREKDICKTITAAEPELIIFLLLIQITVNNNNLYTNLIEAVPFYPPVYNIYTAT